MGVGVQGPLSWGAEGAHLRGRPLEANASRFPGAFPGLRANFWQIFPRDKVVELVSAHPMVHVSAKFDAPGPIYGHFGTPAGHGRARNFGIENDFF